jgi:hypothetical protein
MQRSTLRSPLCAVLSGMWLLACGGVRDDGPLPSEEPLATETSALCSGASVSSLTLSGMSLYQGELAGGGSWAVAYPANAIRLEYYVDGTWRGTDERCNSSGGTSSCTGSGSWSFSSSGMSCGSHSFQVRALPMIIDSAGNRTTCGGTPRTLSTSVLENCDPTTWQYVDTVDCYQTTGHNCYVDPWNPRCPSDPDSKECSSQGTTCYRVVDDYLVEVFECR